jgi:hypothetical protein
MDARLKRRTMAELTRGASKKNGRKRDEDGGVPP